MKLDNFKHGHPSAICCFSDSVVYSTLIKASTDNGIHEWIGLQDFFWEEGARLHKGKKNDTDNRAFYQELFYTAQIMLI